MRGLIRIAGALAVLAAGGCALPSGTLVGAAPPPIPVYAPPPPPPVAYYGPPERCYVRPGFYGPERICRSYY